LIDRREFLLGAFAAAAARTGWGETQAGTAVAAELTLGKVRGAGAIPLTYTGLSYELAQLTDPTFFSAANRDLVGVCSRNGKNRTLSVLETPLHSDPEF